MSDSKISALPPASSVVGSDEFPVNEAGTSKKVTADQIKTFATPAAPKSSKMTGNPQSISNAFTNQASFNAAAWDDDSLVGSNKFTIPSSWNGKRVRVTASVYWDESAVGIRTLDLYSSVSTDLQLVSAPGLAPGNPQGQQLVWIGTVVTGEQLTLKVYQTSGGNLTLTPTMTIEKLN